MTRRTRYFLLGSGGILAAGVATGAVASFMGLPVAVFSRAAGPADLEYVPASAALVAYADVRDIVLSELHRKIRQIEPENRERGAFEEKTGIDVARDVDSVLAALMPEADGSGASGADGVLVLARGQFNAVRLESLAREHGATVEEHEGVRLVRHRSDAPGSADLALGFLEPTLVAIGSHSAVTASIDARRTGRSVLSNTELIRQVNALGASHAWAVGRFDAVATRTRLPGEVMRQLPAVTWFSAAGRVNGGLSATVQIEARDEEAARNVRDVLRGLIALVRMQASERPELQAVVQSVQLSGTGTSVALAFTLPAEVIDALGALAGAHGRAAEGRDEAAEAKRGADDARREAARELLEAAERLRQATPRR